MGTAADVRSFAEDLAAVVVDLDRVLARATVRANNRAAQRRLIARATVEQLERLARNATELAARCRPLVMPTQAEILETLRRNGVEP